MKRRAILTGAVSGSLAVGIAIFVIVFHTTKYDADEFAVSSSTTPSNGLAVRLHQKTIEVFDTGVHARAELVFYPGAKVDPYAYVPMAGSLASRGIRVWIVMMPSDLPILGANRATRVLPLLDDSLPVLMGGHDLGGAMAARHLSRNNHTAAGLIMLASYPRGSTDLSSLDLSVLAIAGSNDLVLDANRFTQSRSLYPVGARLYVVEGANHSGFGSYGQQRGDGAPDISQAAQREIVADLVVDFVDDLHVE